jgi:DKNYY family
VIRSSDAEIDRGLVSRRGGPDLAAFPGKASEIAGANAASFKAFDNTYAKDRSNAYFDGHPITGADATSFDVLDRSGFAKDRNHVYQLDRPISDDPAHFELIDSGLSKDSANVYWTDGGVLSDDPAQFAIVSNNDHYLYTKDSRTVHVNGNPIADADPRSFPRGRAVTNCSEASISFTD